MDAAVASGFRIVEGRVYKYNGVLPPGCKGGLYKVIKFVIDVPSYQEKVLIHCILGKDKGLWFVCTLDNFARRYEPLVVSVEVAEEDEEEQVVEKTIDTTTIGSGI